MRIDDPELKAQVPFINFAYIKGFSNTEGINFNWVPLEYDKQIVIQGIIAAKYILGLDLIT